MSVFLGFAYRVQGVPWRLVELLNRPNPELTPETPELLEPLDPSARMNGSSILTDGPVAQLGARLNGIQEVTGSIPVRSTTPSFPNCGYGRSNKAVSVERNSLRKERLL